MVRPVVRGNCDKSKIYQVRCVEADSLQEKSCKRLSFEELESPGIKKFAIILISGKVFASKENRAVETLIET